MESFQWGPCFVTGLREVDQQHRRLVDLINLFGDGLTGEQGMTFEQLQAVLAELVDYTRYHFRQEEAMMMAAGVDPETASSQEGSHADFLREMVEIGAALTPEHREGAAKLHAFLIHWLAHHILGADQAMARQVLALRAGKSPAEAQAAGRQSGPSATEPLLHALDGLFRRVLERNRELVELNATLEQKVVERTRALSEANEQLSEANRKLENAANTDVLTGLANRRHAMDCFEREWQSSQRSGVPVSCIMLDADHFKEINDTHGHDAGDEVLRRLARQLEHSVRTDDVVCRLGGDEFLILCPRTPLEGALLLAENMRVAVAALRVPAGTGAWNGSISVGVAARREGMETIEDLIRTADEGVYVAKRKGRNAVATVQQRRMSEMPPASRWRHAPSPG